MRLGTVKCLIDGGISDERDSVSLDYSNTAIAHADNFSKVIYQVRCSNSNSEDGLIEMLSSQCSSVWQQRYGTIPLSPTFVPHPRSSWPVHCYVFLVQIRNPPDQHRSSEREHRRSAQQQPHCSSMPNNRLLRFCCNAFWRRLLFLALLARTDIPPVV